MAAGSGHGAGLNVADHEPKPAPKQPDYHFENGLLVYTAAFHLRRGYCCGSGCRHCRPAACHRTIVVCSASTPTEAQNPGVENS